MIEALSTAKCTLLAVDYASNEDITSLSTLCASQREALPTSHVLRILLTYLPETIPPESYIPFLKTLSSGQWNDLSSEHTSLDLSSLHDTSDADAQLRADRLHLLNLKFTGHPPNAPEDDFTLFLCHRAYRVDQETGLLPLVANLVRPFAPINDYLSSWYLSIILPLLRLQYEYYPQCELSLSILEFEDISVSRGLDVLLANAVKTPSTHDETTVSRDLRGLVAPWLSGNPRWHRRQPGDDNTQSKPQTLADGHRISLTDNTQAERADHDWECIFAWLVNRATSDFVTVINAVEHWNGPSDVDFDGLGKLQTYVPVETAAKLDKRYAQSMFAACYVVDHNCKQAIDGAHGILVRLAALLDFEPPPELATSVEQLPLLDQHASQLNEATSPKLLQPDRLLEPEHALTSPTLPSYMLLQMFVYSAYQLQTLGQSISIGNVARMRFFDDADEQLSLLQTIISGLVQQGKRDDQQWLTDRARLVWLWNWNIDPGEGAVHGAGPLGRIDRQLLERSILKAMIDTSNYALIERIYLDEKQGLTRMSNELLEQVILSEALRCYDSASNGNRTRGSMKKASDIISTFKPRFPGSHGFSAASALIVATHSLSFYSLTLQQGVPFQPANIRASSDPLTLLLPKVLEQNPRSYTKLEDLVFIGQNLVTSVAQLGGDAIDHGTAAVTFAAPHQAANIKSAERKVVYMCIEAALKEDDFDTAYSYLVSRLVPSLPGTLTDAQQDATAARTEEPDDMSWRAAFLAGKFAGESTNDVHKTLRRLEQRIELLSLALLLAPTDSLLEILSVYRRCEEALIALVATQSDGEDESLADRSAQRRNVANGHETSALPGEWKDPQTEGMVFGQQTREMGRLASTLAQDRLGPSRKSNESGRPASLKSSTTRERSRGTDSEETLGLFDVARGAAAAFSRNTLLRPGSAASGTRGAHESRPPIAPSARPGSPGSIGSGELSPDFDEHGRTRKRDVVANAVSGTTNAFAGTLTSGLGWVLGATPIEREGHPAQERRQG